jgi:hypothetical protein
MMARLSQRDHKAFPSNSSFIDSANSGRLPTDAVSACGGSLYGSLMAEEIETRRKAALALKFGARIVLFPTDIEIKCCCEGCVNLKVGQG